ncbi:hypothetical protein CTI14_58925, partial [Methylobacterium radiotolerans]
MGGKTIGLVGLGAIGRRMAAMANGLDMRVIGFDCRRTGAGADAGVRKVGGGPGRAHARRPLGQIHAQEPGVGRQDHRPRRPGRDRTPHGSHGERARHAGDRVR